MEDDDGGTTGHDTPADRDRGEPAAAILLASSRALLGWEGLERSTARMLGDLGRALAMPAGALWLATGEVLTASTVWGISDDVRLELERLVRPQRLARGQLLAGSAWERRSCVHRRPGSVPDRAERTAAAQTALRSHVAVPARAGEEVLGVLELYATTHVNLTRRLLDALDATGRMLGVVFARRRGELGISPLTAREMEVLSLAAEGLTGRRIADQLDISPATVKTHFEHIFRRLGVGDRTAAVAHAIRGGLIA